MVAPFPLNTKVSIEKPVESKDPKYGTRSTEWVTVATRIWANLQDTLPSRAEKSENGLRTATQSTRLRIRVGRTIEPKMRVILHGRGDKIMQIVSGPAILDGRMFQECMLEAYTDG